MLQALNNTAANAPCDLRVAGQRHRLLIRQPWVARFDLKHPIIQTPIFGRSRGEVMWIARSHSVTPKVSMRRHFGRARSLSGLDDRRRSDFSESGPRRLFVMLKGLARA